MIRVGKMADYALLILIHLGQNRTALTSMDQLVDATGLSKATVRKVLNLLATAELVKAQRGPAGGYSLSRPLSSISLLEAITALEGPLTLTECCSESSLCEIMDHCNLREKWPSVNDIIAQSLQNITLTDLMHPKILSVKVTGISHHQTISQS